MTKNITPSLKILVVDDERALAKALQLKLTKEGYITDVASNGEEALKLLRNNEYDLLVLDLVMPIMDGFTVLEHLQNEKIKLHVIVASNLGQDEDIKRVKAMNVNEYFVKSNTPLSEIVDYIKTALKDAPHT